LVFTDPSLDLLTSLVRLNPNQPSRSSHTSRHQRSPLLARLRRSAMVQIFSSRVCPNNNSSSSNHSNNCRLSTRCLLLFRSLCRLSRRHKLRKRRLRLFLRLDTRQVWPPIINSNSSSNSNNCRNRVNRRISSMLSMACLRILIPRRVRLNSNPNPNTRHRNNINRCLRLNKHNKHNSRELRRISVNPRLRTSIRQRLPLVKAQTTRILLLGSLGTELDRFSISSIKDSRAILVVSEGTMGMLIARG
jgi:hypothetical protein